MGLQLLVILHLLLYICRLQSPLAIWVHISSRNEANPNDIANNTVVHLSLIGCGVCSHSLHSQVTTCSVSTPIWENTRLCIRKSISEQLFWFPDSTSICRYLLYIKLPWYSIVYFVPFVSSETLLANAIFDSAGLKVEVWRSLSSKFAGNEFGLELSHGVWPLLSD